ncbi:MAG: lipocalin [Deltaproteobacteria bacterium]|nr:lipocalin [Deltaproteobacteria bacterium]
MKKVVLFLVLLLAGCVRLPEGVLPVENFQVERYLGKWYEIARLDHSFERGLSGVSAEYSLRSDGGIRVINRGYSAAENRWKEVQGKAYFVNRPDQGFLKVSFFGPFYGSYVILDLDQKNYTAALVCGPDKSYLWILARLPKLDNDVKKRLIDKAAALGFETNKLIMVRHEEEN